MLPQAYVDISTPTTSGSGLQGLDDVPLDMDDEELDGLAAVSETVRRGTGDKILRAEVENSKGQSQWLASRSSEMEILWAGLTTVLSLGCGRTSSNAVTRRVVASFIDPDRIKKSDLRGPVRLVSQGERSSIDTIIYPSV